MHSKIFQLSSKPIDKDDYKKPECYEGEISHADYIGDEIKGNERQDCIGSLADLLTGIFKPAGSDCLVYLGDEPLRGFLADWAAELRRQASELTPENILRNQRLYNLSQDTKETHKRSAYRLYIAEWNGWAGPFADLIEWAACCLKEGDRVYVGSVTDYHY